MEHDIVGINEISDMAGVSRQAVVNWRSRSADFPHPLQELASGPVFRRAQVRAWLIRNNRKLDELQKGPNFYSRLKSFRNDTNELAACIQNVVHKLENSITSYQKPVMLLGKIQSGKTRAFVGVIASAFDKDFDIALVLTKGTKTLSEQTVSRLCADFAEFIQGDELMVLDIMKLPGKLTRSELRRKIVIVAKKQVHNLKRLAEFMENQPGLQKKKVLIVDDEADLASVRFVQKRGETNISQGTIADQIDKLRELSDGMAFLQVTATPYSLYLQPDNYDESVNTADFVFKPKRPADTELLPIHNGYVGGNDYFETYSDDDPRSQLIVEVSAQEQDALRRPDQRRISRDRVLDSPNTAGLRRAITTFIVAAGVRQWQQRELGKKEKKYSMIIHNDVQKSAHAWQDQVIDWICQEINKAAETNPDVLRPIFDDAFNDLTRSVTANEGKMPPSNEAFDIFIDALQSDDLVVERVNSDHNVVALLDDKAELRLRTPYNIFVGGNILDRGITIPNLIAFYYGRNPLTMQADTVLQHSRMYGNRHRDDLAVTRLYTSRAVFDRLFTINSFENALRKAFETGAHDKGVVFIQTDATRRVRPCAPNKVLLSNVVAVSPDTMLLPSDFQTAGGARMAKIQNKLEKLIKQEWRDSGEFILIDRETALEIIDAIQGTMEFDNVEFEWDAMRGLIDYYADESEDGKILLLAETGRELTRAGSGDKSGRSILGTVLRSKVLDTPRTKPALILLQQKGGRERGWSAHSFWWPILAAPTDAEPCVFATKTAV
ncbi:MAG: hypothetical protein KC643_15380 [Nitrospira sp.]|nr:hypothetical protein [Nitrospira sp.]